VRLSTATPPAGQAPATVDRLRVNSMRERDETVCRSPFLAQVGGFQRGPQRVGGGLAAYPKGAELWLFDAVGNPASSFMRSDRGSRSCAADFVDSHMHGDHGFRLTWSAGQPWWRGNCGVLDLYGPDPLPDFLESAPTPPPPPGSVIAAHPPRARAASGGVLSIDGRSPGPQRPLTHRIPALRRIGWTRKATPRTSSIVEQGPGLAFSPGGL